MSIYIGLFEGEHSVISSNGVPWWPAAANLLFGARIPMTEVSPFVDLPPPPILSLIQVNRPNSGSGF